MTERLKRGDLVMRKDPHSTKGLGWVYSVSLHAISSDNPEFSDHGMMVRIAWAGRKGGILEGILMSEWTAAGLLYVEKLPVGYKTHPVHMDGTFQK